MFRNTICAGLLAVKLSFGLCVSTASAATVIGQNGVTAAMYANPFDPNLDGVISGSETTITAGAIGPGTVSGLNLSRVINRVDARGSDNGGGRIQDNSGVATQGYMQFEAATPFNVGTVLSVQRVTEGVNAPMNFDLQLGNNSGLSSVQTGPGTVGTHPYQITNFENQLLNQTQMRIELGMATQGAGTATMGAMQEVMLFANRLEAIPVTNITASPLTFGTVSGIYDFSGSTGTGSVGGWASSTPGANPFFQLDFGTDRKVNGLVLANWENIPIAGDILDDNNTIIAQFTMSGNGTFGEILPIEFITPVTTSWLRVNFTNAGNIGIREAIALTEIDFMLPAPEPSSLALAAAGMIVLASARRRRRD